MAWHKKGFIKEEQFYLDMLLLEMKKQVLDLERVQKIKKKESHG